MSLNQDQKEALEKLYIYRKNIEDNISNIEELLQTYFPKQFPAAYQFWIPQLKTSLRNNTKWLPRGTHTLQDTIDRINDSEDGSGVTKYINLE